MTTVSTLQAIAKTAAGTGSARATRRAGRVPGVLYGKNQTPVMFSVDIRDLVKEIKMGGLHTRIYNLNVEDKTYPAIAREVQFHPVTDQPMHLDLVRVDRGSRIHVSVPIAFANEDKCPGLKRGGVLNVIMHTIELSCTAENIPEHVTINLEGLDIHDSVHAHDLALPKGVTVHGAADHTLVTIVPPTVRTETAETSAS